MAGIDDALVFDPPVVAESWPAAGTHAEPDRPAAADRDTDDHAKRARSVTSKGTSASTESGRTHAVG